MSFCGSINLENIFFPERKFQGNKKATPSDTLSISLKISRLVWLYGADDGTRTRTMFPSPDFKSDASTDSATSPILWRYLPDLNWRSQSWSLLPYHLAKVPFRCALLLYMNSYQNARLKWNDFRRFSKRKRRRLRRLFSYAQSTKTQLFNCF